MKGGWLNRAILRVKNMTIEKYREIYNLIHSNPVILASARSACEQLKKARSLRAKTRITYQLFCDTYEEFYKNGICLDDYGDEPMNSETKQIANLLVGSVWNVLMDTPIYQPLFA